MSEEKKKKRGRPPKSTKSEESEHINFFNNEKVKVLFAVFLLFLTIYLGISFISFLFTWKPDIGLFQMGFFHLLGRDVVVSNAMGKLGAYLSILFIYRWFGIPAFIFLFLFPLIALKLLNVNIKNFSSIVIKTLAVTVWLSLTFALMFGKGNFAAGGVYPYEIVKWISSALGKFGTGFILFLVGLGLVFFFYDNSFVWTKEFFSNLFKGKSIKLAFEETSEKISFFGKRNDKTEQIEMDENEEENNGLEDETNETYEEEGSLLNGIYENPQKQDDEKLVDDKGFIVLPDGTKIPKQNNGLGFEVEKPEGEEVVEEDENSQNQIINNYLSGKSEGMEVVHKEDIEGDLDQLEDYDPTKSLSHFKLPALSLLKNHTSKVEVTKEELLENRNKIVQTLKNYKIDVRIEKATVGPTVTLYEIVPAPGVRISKIKNLEDDIALSLAALGIRIIAPMPGRGTIGIEVPNKKPAIVSLKSVLSSLKYQKSKYELPIAIGKTISNETYVFDLTKMPHLLIAGATGQGKSVGLNVILASILYKKHPAFVKFVLIDPKKVELVIYERIEKHYLAKLPGEEEAIITDPQKAKDTLNSLTKEMEERYSLLKKARVRNIKEYNEKFINRRLLPSEGHKFMPYIVLVIDEFADLIMTSGKEIEMPLARLAQLARAVGIHLIVATQRPSTNIITGAIKANFPGRIAFKVAQMVDSRTILDQPGANQLVGKGDMLITNGSELIRIQCAFVDTEEVNNIVDYIEAQQSYPSAFELPEPDTGEDEGPGAVDLSKRDPLFDDAAKLVVISQQGSTSMIQRKLSIGYNRAGRIMDQLEAAGIVGPGQGSKPRDVLISDIEQLISYLESLNSIY